VDVGAPATVDPPLRTGPSWRPCGPAR